MVKKYPHMRAMPVGSRHEALLGMAEHKLNLFARYLGEPVQEIVNPGAAFQIFK
jgi:hypothetical protein